MIKTLTLSLFTALYVCLSASVYAQDQATLPINPDKDKPIEITALKTLEWDRNKKQYTAHGQAQTIQGDVTIKAETLIADYRDGQGSQTQIWQFTAKENVIIENAENTAYGEKAVYDIDQGLATLTGNNLKLVSPDQVITARDRFEYRAPQNKALAIGNAKVTRGEDSLKADQIAALFENDQNGERKIKEMTATGNVIIITPTETLKGDRGVYKAATNTAVLTGNVRIERGPNVLEGNRAEVDLTTNISKMFGNEAAGERVRGVFYPSSEDLKKSESQ